MSHFYNFIFHKIDSLKKSYLLIVLLSFFSILGNAQIPITGFNCEFSSQNANFLVCGSEITATVSLPTSTPLTQLQITHPNSFIVCSVVGGAIFGSPVESDAIGPPISTAPGALISQNILINSNETTLTITFSYVSFNAYSATTPFNANALYFDCNGVDNNSEPHAADLSIASNSSIISIGFGGYALVNSSNIPYISLNTITPTPINGQLNQIVSRRFRLNLNSQNIQSFSLLINQEYDAEFISLNVVNGSSILPVSNVIGQNTLYNIADLSGFVQNDANGVRFIVFEQVVKLLCNPQNIPPLVTTVSASASCGCDPTIQDYSSNSISMNVTTGQNPVIALQSTLLTPADETSSPCSGEYYYDFTFTVSGVDANFQNIQIPISAFDGFTVNSVSIGQSYSNLTLLSNPTTSTINQTTFVTIDANQFESNNPWPGFSNDNNGTPGAWIILDGQQSKNIFIRLTLTYDCNINPTWYSQLKSNDGNAEITYAFTNSCGILSNGSFSFTAPNNLVVPDVLLIGGTEMNIDIAETDAAAFFNYNLILPNGDPFQIYNGSQSVANCSNVVYKGTIQATFPAGFALFNVSNLLIDNTSVSVNNEGNGVYTFDIPSTFSSQQISFLINNISCPGPPSATFGSIVFNLSVEAICADCSPLECSRPIVNASDLLFVHCPGDYESIVGIKEDLTIDRTSLGWSNASNYPTNPIPQPNSSLNLDRIYPFDLFTIRAEGGIKEGMTINNNYTLFNHSNFGFEIAYSLHSGLTEDFFQLFDYTAIFTQGNNTPIPITTGLSLIPFGQQVIPGLPPNLPMALREYRWDINWLINQAQIPINNGEWEIELTARFRATPPPTATPGFYAIDALCQFVSNSNQNGSSLTTKHSSCDPYGDKFLILIPEVEVFQATVSAGPAEFIINDLPDEVYDFDNTNWCQFGHVVGLKHNLNSGLGTLIDDFSNEFRPLTAWPQNFTNPFLEQVDDLLAPPQPNYSYSVNAGLAANTSTGMTNLLPARKRRSIANGSFQGLALTMGKTCPISTGIIPINLPINQFAYIHNNDNGHFLEPLPSTIPLQNITIPELNSIDLCSSMNIFPQVSPQNFLPEGGGTYNFTLSAPQAGAGLPVAIRITPSNVNSITLSNFVFGGNVQNLNSGWYIFPNGFPNEITNNASITIGLVDPCYNGIFSLNFEWKVFCKIEQLNNFIADNENESCMGCNKVIGFRRGTSNLNNVSQESIFNYNEESCSIVWKLKVTNPVNQPTLSVTELNLNVLTGLVLQNNNVTLDIITNGVVVSSPIITPTYEMIVFPPPISLTFFSLTLSIDPSSLPILVPPGSSLVYTVHFQPTTSVCESNFSGTYMQAFLTGKNVCNDEITPNPITININNLHIANAIANLPQSECCLNAPLVSIQHLCNSTDGSITIDALANYIIKLYSTVGLPPIEYNVTEDGPFTIPISSVGTYGLYIQSNGAIFTQTILISNHGFDLTPISNQAICIGDQVNLIALPNPPNSTSGTIYTYSWITTEETSSSINVSPTTTTEYTVTVSNGSCNANTSTTITVNPIPEINITGNTTICQGQNTSLTASSNIDGSSFQWTGGPSNAVFNNITTAGTYTVTATASGCSATASTTVTVNPLPDVAITANGPTTFCQGESVTLNGPAGDGLNYLWSNGAATQNINVNSSGAFALTVTNANSCTATSVPTQVTINPNPTLTITGVTTICAGQSTTLTATTIPANAAIQWTNGLATQNFSVSQAGNYSATATLNGCSSSADFELSLFPQTQVFILPEMSSVVVCEGSEVDLESSETSGIIWSNGNLSQTISVSELGTYILTYTDPNGCISTASIDVVADPDLLCACPDCPNTNLTPINVTSDISNSTDLINFLGGNISIDNFCIRLNHDFIVNSTIIFSNCEIIVAPGKTIKNFNRLIFSNTSIKGCEKLWQGVENYKSLVISDNSVLQDAVYAIQTFLNIETSDSHTNVINSTLKNNFIGIINLTEFNSNINIYVNESNFIGGNILNPYNNQTVVTGTKSFAGIVLNNGIVFTNFNNNHFNNLCVGVLNNNSTIDSHYNTFENIQDFEPTTYNGNNYYMETVQGAGVGFYSTNNANTTIYGLGNDINSQSTFYNTNIGVFNYASDLTIRDCKFDFTNNQNKKGIYVMNPTGTPPSRINIYQNRINSAYEAIDFNLTDNVIAAGITENIIDMNFSSITPSRYGIRINNIITGGKITISKNNITLENQLFTSIPSFGISANVASNVRILENTINSKVYSGVGIRLTNSPNSILNCNGIYSLNQGLLTNNQTSIYQSMSAATRLVKNTTEGSRTGFRFLDNNTNTDLRSNFIGNHTTGILISSGIIGDQENKGNRWFGSYPVGSNKFGARVNLADVPNNRFKVHPTSNAEFYPHYFPNYQSNCLSGDFFQCVFGLNEPNYGPCYITTPNPPSSIAVGDSEKWLEIASQMAASSLQFPVYNEEYNFYTLRDVEDAISNGWVHLADTGIFILFKAMLAESAARRLNQAEHHIRASLPDSAITNQIDLLRIDWQELRILVGEIDEQYAANPADTSLIIARNTLVNQMNIIQQQINLIRQGVLQVQGYTRDSTFTYLGGLVTPQEYAEYDRVVSQLYLSTIAQGNFSFSESDSITLYNIATLCPALGGKAVYKARSLYTLLNDSIYFDDDSLCVSQSVMFREQDTETLHQSFELQAKVYPNPTNGQVRVDFNFTPEQFIVFKLYDGTGKLLGNKTITNKEFEFSIKELTNESGLYFYELTDANSKFRQTGKISFIK
jgi:hypothetical protein